MGRIHNFVRPHYAKFVEDVDPTELVDKLMPYITKRDKDTILTETRNHGNAAGAGKLLRVIDGKVYEYQLVEALEACGYHEMAALLQGRQPPPAAAGASHPGQPPTHPHPPGHKPPSPVTQGPVNWTITNMGTIAIQQSEPGGINNFVVAAVPSSSGIEVHDPEEAAGTEEEYEVCVQETSQDCQPHSSQTASSSGSPVSEQLYSRGIDEHRGGTAPGASAFFHQDQDANRPARKLLQQFQLIPEPADSEHQETPEQQRFNLGRQDSSPFKSRQQTDGKESPPEHRTKQIGQPLSRTSSQGSPRHDGDDPVWTLGVEMRSKSVVSPQESGNVPYMGAETEPKVPYVPDIETARGSASGNSNFQQQSLSSASSSAADDLPELDLRSTASLREMNNAGLNAPSRGRDAGPQRVLDSNLSSVMINSEEFRPTSHRQQASSTADSRNKERHQQIVPAENLPPANPQQYPLLPVMVEAMEVSGMDSFIYVDGQSSELSAGENIGLRSSAHDIPAPDCGDVYARASSHSDDEGTSSTLVSSNSTEAADSNDVDASLLSSTASATERGENTVSNSPDLPIAATEADDAVGRGPSQSEASSSFPLVSNGVGNHGNGLSAEMSNHVDAGHLRGSASATEDREIDSAANSTNRTSWWRRGWDSLGEYIISG